MNDLVRFANSVEYATGKKRGRHPVFNSNQFYPYKAERRLQSATVEEIERYIGIAYEAAITGEVFVSDTLEDLSNLTEGLSDNFKREVSYAAESIAKKVSENVVNMSEMVIGKPYYPPETKSELLKNWEANFQTLCKSAKSDAKKEISRIVKQAKDEGWNGKQLEKAIKGELPKKYKGRAELIARTESAKLNSDVTRETYKEIGVEYYVWMATMDERVRPEHANMNGQICSVANPDVIYEENPDDPLHPIEKPRGDDMVHLHPGEDFQCRCTMVAWDPEIDGKYEVKERPLPEEQQEPTRESENDPQGREFERARERVVEQENELKSAKNELKTAKKELESEKTARKAAENEKNEAVRAKKSAEKRAEMAEKTKLQAEQEKIALENAKTRAEMSRQAAVIARNYGLNLQSEIEAPSSSLKKANPNFGKPGYDENCQRSATAYIARSRGLDVEALEFPGEPDTFSEKSSKGQRGYLSAFNGGKTAYVKKGTRAEAKKEIERIALEAGDGSQFIIFVSWSGKPYGHNFIVENNKGVVKFLDPQTNNKSCSYYFELIKVRTEYPEITRVDNLELNGNIRAFVK